MNKYLLLGTLYVFSVLFVYLLARRTFYYEGYHAGVYATAEACSKSAATLVEDALRDYCAIDMTVIVDRPYEVTL